MKHPILLLSFAVLLAACGGSNNSSNNNTEAADESAASRQSEAVHDTSINNIGTEDSGGAGSSAKGAQLIANSDCMSCHKETERLVGPAYSEVAEKYPNNQENIEMLAGKIIEGGAGNWGQTPMTPHPSLSKSDAEEMVKYILTIK